MIKFLLLFENIKASTLMKNGITLALLAVVVAVGSAFTTTTKTAPKKASFDPAYYWYTPSFDFQRQETTVNEIDLTGCDGALVVCERGYNAGQLIDPQQPQLGVKEEEQLSPQEIIFQTE
jgi:hypothetical protein